MWKGAHKRWRRNNGREKETIVFLKEIEEERVSEENFQVDRCRVATSELKGEGGYPIRLGSPSAQ